MAEKFILIKELNKIYYLRRLQTLLHNFSNYQLDQMPVPNAYSLVQEGENEGGYKAIVCEEFDEETGTIFWKSALLFKIVREKRAVYHTIAKIDYVFFDANKPSIFSSLSLSLKMIAQFILKKSKASMLDLMINTDSGLNATVYLYLRRCLLMENFQPLDDGSIFLRRLRYINPRTGKNEVSLALPRFNKDTKVVGMRVEKQGEISKRPNGGKVLFLNKVEYDSDFYKKILDFSVRNSSWASPDLKKRVSYMQTHFNTEGDVKSFVDSLVNDCRFLILTNPKTNNITSFMPVSLGFSIPCFTSDTPVVPSEIAFIPLILAQRGDNNRITKIGFMQEQELYKALFDLLKDSNIKLVATLVKEDSVDAALLRLVHFQRAYTFSISGENYSYYFMQLN